MASHDGPEATWDRVAEAWDSSVDYVNTHTSAATDQMIDSLSVQPGERVVELAGGPGSLGERWSRLVGPDGDVLVTDLAPAMVEAAERRLAQLDNVRTRRLDLSRIDMPDASVDVAVCRFGLMFVAEPEAALAELRRILAPGGRLGAMTWAGIEHNPWLAIIGMAATVSGVTDGGPPVGPGEIFSLSDPDHLADLARAAGFTGVEVASAAVAFRAPDVGSHMDKVVGLAGPLAAPFEAATAEQLAEVRRIVAEGAEPFATEDGYELPGRALVLTARL